MSDSPALKPLTSGGGLASLAYFLQMIGLLISPLAAIGLTIAVLNLDTESDWLHSHYRIQVRTFGIGALYLLAASVLLFVSAYIGLPLFAVVALWLFARCIKGLVYVGRHRPYPNASTWLV